MDLEATCCRSPPHHTRITVSNTFLARARAPLARSKSRHLDSREKLILCNYMSYQVEARRLTDEHFFAKEPGSMLWPLNWPKQVHTPQQPHMFFFLFTCHGTLPKLGGRVEGKGSAASCSASLVPCAQSLLNRTSPHPKPNLAVQDILGGAPSADNLHAEDQQGRQ